MKSKLGWKWTKEEYPMIILWISSTIFLISNKLNLVKKSTELSIIYFLGCISIFSIVIFYLLIKDLNKDTKKKLPEEDERTKKINYKAKNYSWHTTYILVLIISVFASIYDISHIITAGLIILSMITSQFIFVIYFNIKGDGKI